VKTKVIYMALTQEMHRRSLGVLQILHTRLERIVGIWLCLIALAVALRLAISPISPNAFDGVTILPYLLLVGAPVASLFLALHWFRDAGQLPQPQTRLAVVGRWRSLSAIEARRHHLYGSSGFMVSLLVGMLLHTPMRAASYLATMPAITHDAPGWLMVLHFWMTLDTVLLSSLYAICFAAALRKLPLFPRLLLLVWMIDLCMQLLIAQATAASGLPESVAAPLHMLLEKNVTKVLISVSLWLPYLLLSTRVNVTFRHRIPLGS
jgi:hypothetical protein